MKKIILISALFLIAGFTFAGDDQSSQLKKFLNRKIIFPEQLKITEKTMVEIQIEIMPDGCLALIASNGNNEIINYIASRLEGIKLPYNQGGTNVYSYRFTFEKELSQN